jgi:hypothetical protein
MVQAGAGPELVQGQMRDSRISTTLDIYAQCHSVGTIKCLRNDAQQHFGTSPRTWAHTCISLDTAKNSSTLRN